MFNNSLLHRIVEVVSDPTTKGIIIGSLFTLLGVFFQGIVSFLLEGRKYKLAMKNEKQRNEFSKEEQTRKEKVAYARELQQKREKAYLDFVNFYNRLLVGLLALTKIKKNVEVPKIEQAFDDKSKEQLVFILGQSSDLNTAIRLYGSKEICAKANEFVNSYIDMETSGIITYDKVLSLANCLDALIYAMNEENQLFEPCGIAPKLE